jgi:hypothetical protein
MTRPTTNGLPAHHADYKQLRNAHYRKVRHAKDSMWKAYLAAAEGPDIWAAFHYTNPRRA